jgi:hypothetical protein
MNLTFIETTIGNAEFSSRNKSESKPSREIVRPIVGETNRAEIELTFGDDYAVRRKLQEKRAGKRNRGGVFALVKGAVPSPTSVDSLPALWRGGRPKRRSQSARLQPFVEP